MRSYNGEIKSISKLNSFRRLAVGWHYGVGAPPSETTIKIARSIIEKASLSLFKTDVFPGEGGEVQVNVYYRDYYLEFVIDPDGLITFVYEENDQEMDYQEDLSFDDAILKISEFRKNVCQNTSELSTQGITIIEKNVSQVWPLRIQQVVGSLSSIWNASKTMGTESVPTSESIITQTPESHQSSGSYLLKNCQMVGNLIPTQVQQAIYATGT